MARCHACTQRVHVRIHFVKMTQSQVVEYLQHCTGRTCYLATRKVQQVEITCRPLAAKQWQAPLELAVGAEVKHVQVREGIFSAPLCTRRLATSALCWMGCGFLREIAFSRTHARNFTQLDNTTSHLQVMPIQYID